MSGGIRYHHLTHRCVMQAARTVADMITVLHCTGAIESDLPVMLYGIPRGGVPASYLVAKALEEKNATVSFTHSPEMASYIIDDLVDSGKTKVRHKELYPNTPFFALFEKPAYDDRWYVFPWETTGDETGLTSAEDIPTRLLQYIGEDTTREGLKETPKRFLKAMNFWTSGYKKDPAEVFKAFADGGETYDQIVFQGGMRLYSLCEHHIAPFFGEAYIGYIPDKQILGLSKFNRVIEIFARRLQVQERLTWQIAEAFQTQLKCKAVGVVIECRHLCVESRGVERPGTKTITSAMLGRFREDHSARSEFFHLVDLSKRNA